MTPKNSALTTRRLSNIYPRVPIYKGKQAKSASGRRGSGICQGELRNLLELIQEHFILENVSGREFFGFNRPEIRPKMEL